MPSPPSPSEDPRWYRDGLRFDCTACGNCCRDHGEYTYVYISDADLVALAACLGLPEEQVEELYCQFEDGWRHLKREKAACTFLNDKGLCSVYEGRPKQCRTWPFWQDTLASKADWSGLRTRLDAIYGGRRVSGSPASQLIEGGRGER